MRDVILGRSDLATSAIRGRIEFGVNSDPVRPWAAQRQTHIAYGSVVQGQVGICIKIFDLFSGVIFVSGSADRYVRGPYDTNSG